MASRALTAPSIEIDAQAVHHARGLKCGFLIGLNPIFRDADGPFRVTSMIAAESSVPSNSLPAGLAVVGFFDTINRDRSTEDDMITWKNRLEQLLDENNTHHEALGDRRRLAVRLFKDPTNGGIASAQVISLGSSSNAKSMSSDVIILNNEDELLRSKSIITIRCPLTISLTYRRPTGSSVEIAKRVCCEAVNRKIHNLLNDDVSFCALSLKRDEDKKESNSDASRRLLFLDQPWNAAADETVLEILQKAVSDLESLALFSTRRDQQTNAGGKRKGKKGKKKKKKKKKSGNRSNERASNEESTSVSESLLFRDTALGKRTVTCRLLDNVSTPSVCEGLTFRFDGTSCTDDTIEFGLDVLCYAPACASARDVFRELRNGVVRQLQHQARLALDSTCLPRAVSAFHFRPPIESEQAMLSAHCFTVSYVDPSRPSLSVDRRDALHRCLCVPRDRPHLRPCAAISIPASKHGVIATGSTTRDAPSIPKRVLRDVHVGLSKPQRGGSVRLVRGSYEYYHYMQGHFDDAGWGCAYRSLQTIVSWFKLNHYCDPDVFVPTHAEIQQTLVDLKDKPAPFVGSKQWIGSTEIGYVVEHLLGVKHKIVFLSSGKDMPTASRQLKEHFETQGTPVMIGGGALAFTLIGISYDESTGETSWLILDPHYTGPDDLATIQTKSYMLEGYRAVPCSWRGLDAFSAHSSYNLYLPQRPVDV